jgi:RNA recognition motif-containing protein
VNWATGLPGVQPKWEGEYSIFVGDLGREVTEGELVALFTPLFQSTKSAKIMYDPSTGLSRGYGFVRFGDENDMSRSLALGQNTSGSGLSLRGRTLRISEASGSGGSRNRTSSGNNELENVAPNGNVVNGSNGNGHVNPPVQGKNGRELNIKVPM